MACLKYDNAAMIVKLYNYLEIGCFVVKSCSELSSMVLYSFSLYVWFHEIKMPIWNTRNVIFNFFTNIMPNISKCKGTFDNISGTIKRIIKSVLFDFERWGAKTPHVPTHV